MQRALDNLERSARIESERAKQSFEIQQEAELTLSQKFKSIVSDLRKSWDACKKEVLKILLKDWSLEFFEDRIEKINNL